MKRSVTLKNIVFPVCLILFIVQMLLLPVMLGSTYATRSERPEHILTYTDGALTWDKNTSLLSDGSARLSFFETLYENVSAEKAEKVLAPGTEKDTIVRLQNGTKRSVEYTAVLYSLSTAEELDIQASLSGSGFEDAAVASLPGNIAQDAVIRTVEGTVDADAMQEFEINWFWSFEGEADTDARDKIDTYLGNKSADGAADETTLGFYLVVRDNGTIPPAPQTGDRTALIGYAALLAVSGAALLLPLLLPKRKKHDER